MKKRLFFLFFLIFLLSFKPSFIRAASVSQTKFGIFYLIWHCPSINVWPLHYQSYGNNGILDVTEILAGKANWGPIPAFHYWGKPQLGYYCLSQNEIVLREHAKMLQELGVDFVFVDITNWDVTDNSSTGSKAMIMDPFAKLLQVWSTIPNAPKVVPWVRTRNESESMVNFITNTLDLYPSMKFFFQGKPLLLTGFAQTDELTNQTLLNRLKETYTVRMMKGVGDGTPSVTTPNWYWLQLCADGFRQNNGNQTCNQPIAFINGSLEQIPIATAFQETYMSKTDTATPKFDGRTLQKQFETLFNNPGTPIAMIVSFNEFIAQRFCLDNTSNATHNNCTDQNDHWPNGNKIFVDQYNKDFNRDIEPAENGKGDLYFKITKACISLYKQGERCDENNQTNLCCNTPSYLHGYVDVFRCDNSSWNFAGWAKDDRDNANKVTVRAEVYPDNEPYNKVTFVGAKPATGTRSDLTGICPPNGACTFSVKIDSLPQTFLNKKIRTHLFAVASNGDSENEIEFNFGNNLFGPCNNLVQILGDLDGNNMINIFDLRLFLTKFLQSFTIFSYNKLVENFGR